MANQPIKYGGSFEKIKKETPHTCEPNRLNKMCLSLVNINGPRFFSEKWAEKKKQRRERVAMVIKMRKNSTTKTNGTSEPNKFKQIVTNKAASDMETSKQRMPKSSHCIFICPNDLRRAMSFGGNNAHQTLHDVFRTHIHTRSRWNDVEIAIFYKFRVANRNQMRQREKENWIAFKVFYRNHNPCWLLNAKRCHIPNVCWFHAILLCNSFIFKCAAIKVN